MAKFIYKSNEEFQINFVKSGVKVIAKFDITPSEAGDMRGTMLDDEEHEETPTKGGSTNELHALQAEQQRLEAEYSELKNTSSTQIAALKAQVSKLETQALDSLAS